MKIEDEKAVEVRAPSKRLKLPVRTYSRQYQGDPKNQSRNEDREQLFNRGRGRYI